MLPPDDDRATAKIRSLDQFHRSEEGIHINVQDAGLRIIAAPVPVSSGRPGPSAHEASAAGSAGTCAASVTASATTATKSVAAAAVRAACAWVNPDSRPLSIAARIGAPALNRAAQDCQLSSISAS